jgi:hypothetical protein
MAPATASRVAHASFLGSSPAPVKGFPLRVNHLWMSSICPSDTLQAWPRVTMCPQDPYGESPFLAAPRRNILFLVV